MYDATNSHFIIFSHVPGYQARLALGLGHEVVCDIARRLSDFAIQKMNYDRVRMRRISSLSFSFMMPNAHISLFVLSCSV
jgi:hypothetical protein